MTMQMVMPTSESPLPDPNGWPVQGEWQYADYQRLPNDGKRYEIIKGVLYVANAPSVEHQFTVSEVHFALKLFVRERQPRSIRWRVVNMLFTASTLAMN